MRRPEGFDRGQRPPVAPAREKHRDAKPAVAKPAIAPKPPRVQPERRAKPLAHPARSRSARADFAAADRRRRRDEKAEARRFTRSSRRRRAGWLSAAAVLAALVAMVLVAVFSPILALRHITVDGTQRLDPAVLAEAVDGQLGTPLALLDQDRIRTELGKFTLIRSYVTELVPPDTLLIHVVERAPIGVIAAPEGFLLVDPAGVTVDSLVAKPDGYPELRLAAGDDVHGAGFRGMAEVLLALPPAVLAQVQTIEARTHDDVTLTLAGSSQRVKWGSAEGSVAKAATLAGLIALHQGDGAGEYDVSAPGVAVFHKD